MDLDKDGTISYTEFIVFVRDPCHPFLEQKVRYATHRGETTAELMRRTRCGMSMITDQVWLVYGTLEWCSRG